MSLRPLRGAKERLHDSEDRLLQEFAALIQGASQSRMTPDPPVVCPNCRGQVPPRETRCPHCGHDFAAVTPEVAEHARSKVRDDSGFEAWLRVWSRVIAMAALAILANLHAPGAVVVALAVLVALLPGLLSLTVIPIALTLLPWAHLHGPATILGILTLCAWRAGARFLHRPMLGAEPLAATAVGGLVVVVLGTGLYALGWIEYPAWYARTRVQPSDREVVRSALDVSLPDTVSIVRVQSPGRPWPLHASDRLKPVLYDMELDAEGWPALAAAISPAQAFSDEETTRTVPRLSDVFAFAGKPKRPAESGEEMPLTVCREENNLLVALDAASSPTLHLFVAIVPDDR